MSHLVKKLRKQAAAHARSAEAEHRDSLARALCSLKNRSVAEALMSMPDVGEDADFERVNGSDKTAHVFG